MRFRHVLLIFVASLACLPCSASNGQDPTLLGRWEVGHCLGGTVAEGFAYYGNGSCFEIADIGDPHAPVAMGSLQLPDLIYDVTVAGDLAYVADSECGLQIIDVSQEQAPRLVGSCETGRSAQAIAVSGNHVYLADAWDGLLIIDVSDPEHPCEVCRLDPGWPPESMAIRGNLLYMACFTDGIWIVDISDPEDPVLVHNFGGGTGGMYSRIVLRGDYLYCAAGLGGLRVFDLSDPLNPSPVGSLDLGDWTHFLDLGQDAAGTPLAVLTGSVYGLRVVDISDPNDLREVGNLSAHDRRGVTCAGTFCYMAARSDGLRIIDLADAANPVEVASCEVGGFAQAVVVRDGLAYVNEGCSAVRILDVSDPQEPTPIGLCRLPSPGYGLALVGSHIYLGTVTGLCILDVSDPTQPLVVDPYPLTGGVTGMAVHEEFLVCINGIGLAVLDVSHPTAPAIHGKLEMDGLSDVAVGTEYAYLTALGDYPVHGGLFVVDYAALGKPVVVGFLDVAKAQDVAVHGDLAFVGGATPEWDWGLMVVDVSEPAAPEWIGFWEWDAPLVAIAATEDFVYFSLYLGDDLMVLDVQDPATPRMAGSFASCGFRTRCVAAQDGLIYVNGGWILRNGLVASVEASPAPAAIRLERSYPNPLGRSSSITYHLAARQIVRLGVYDVAGRLVCMLRDECQEGPGRHSAVWEGKDMRGRDVAAGAYFVRLDAGPQTATMPLVLVR